MSSGACKGISIHHIVPVPTPAHMRRRPDSSALLCLQAATVVAPYLSQAQHFSDETSDATQSHFDVLAAEPDLADGALMRHALPAALQDASAEDLQDAAPSLVSPGCRETAALLCVQGATVPPHGSEVQAAAAYWSAHSAFCNCFFKTCTCTSCATKLFRSLVVADQSRLRAIGSMTAGRLQCSRDVKLRMPGVAPQDEWRTK